MRIKHLLIGMLAVAAAVACKQDEPVETPKLDVDKTAVQVAATAGEASFSVTTNQDWTASPDADWVSVDPATGKGSDKAVTVKVTAEDNTSEEPRTAKITVKAGELTKTVSVTQAAGQGEEPGPGQEPEPDADTYLLVGDAVGGWNFDNPVVLTLTEGYYVAKEVGVTGEKDMHFTKNSSWEGNVKGLHGRIAPNEIGEVGENNISLTVGGAYDIYLAESLDKFYFMTPGKTPAEAVEHVEIATVWGICGAIEGNAWGASKDPVLSQEGEWFVAKDVIFTEVNFKIRGNNTWADDLKWGVDKDQACKLNTAIPVMTCTEYKSKYPEESDNPNVYVGGAGTYDVYFSPEKKEVWVMTPGYKPGDETPVVDVTYTVAGTIDGHVWENNAEIGLMALEGEYYVAKNIPFVWASSLYDDDNSPISLKIFETGTWNGYGTTAGDSASANTEISVVEGGQSNILVAAPAGTYDVYFDKANSKVWVMEPGLKPGDAPVSTYSFVVYVDDQTGWDEIALYQWGDINDLGGTWPGKAVSETKTVNSVDYKCFVYGSEVQGLKQNLILNNNGNGQQYSEYAFTFPTESGELYLLAKSGQVVAVDPNNRNDNEISAPSWGLIGVNDDWNNDVEMEEDGDMFVAKGVVFNAGVYFKIRYNKSWNDDAKNIGLGSDNKGGAFNAAIPVVAAGTSGNVWIEGDPQTGGTYDVYFDFTNLQVWVMTPGYKPGETPVVEPEGPKKVTVAEFLAAEDNEIEYQVSGTISGIYQAYNANYDNISIYISDETGEMLAYRLSCEGIDDPANTITKGDLITVRGLRTLYNESPQMAAGCVIVEHTDVVIEAPEGSVTLSFADVANRTTFTTSQQVWEQNGIKLINDKASSTSNVADYSAPARFYKNSKITVEYAGMTKIDFVCNSSSYATALQSSITTGNVSVNGSVVTVTLGEAVDSYVVSALSGGQVRMDSLTVYTE